MSMVNDNRPPVTLTQWDPPLCLSREPVEAAIPDERRDQRADTPHELLQRRQSPPNARVRDLSLVQGREHGKHSNAHARQEPSGIHIVDVLRAGLDAAAQEEHDAACEDRKTAAYQVCQTAYVDIAGHASVESLRGQLVLRGLTMRMLLIVDTLR